MCDVGSKTIKISRAKMSVFFINTRVYHNFIVNIHPSSNQSSIILCCVFCIITNFNLLLQYLNYKSNRLELRKINNNDESQHVFGSRKKQTHVIFCVLSLTDIPRTRAHPNGTLRLKIPLASCTHACAHAHTAVRARVRR